MLGKTITVRNPQDIRELYAEINKDALEAAKKTVDIAAALTRRKGIASVERQFTLRNTWTKRNIGFDKSNPAATKLADVKSEVGARSGAAYLERQEFGGEHKAKKDRLAIPDKTARGGSPKSPVLKKMYRSRIGKRMVEVKSSEGKAALVRAAYSAFHKNGFLKIDDLVYRVTSFEKTGGSVKFEKELVYNEKFASTKTPKSEWLTPASLEVGKDLQKIFNSQMKKLTK